MKKALLSLLLLTALTGKAQVTIHTNDLDNYWTAYDSITQTHDFSKRIALINHWYIDKGSKGLHAFMQARKYKDTLFVKLIEAYPKFWESIRPHTLAMKEKAPEIQQAALRFKELYPQLKPAEIYFTIGSFRSGGTIKDNMLLIGGEIIGGRPDTDISEMPSQRLAHVFQQQTDGHVVSLCVHEYVHTQQKGYMTNLLSASIGEGMCDFITELVLGRPLETSYLTYGRAHAGEVKARFRKEMFSDDWDRWLYNTGAFFEAGDMGYYVGYEICKAYYNKSRDKKKAIKDIIRLKLDSPKAVERFLAESGYYDVPIDKEKILKEYNESLPYIVSMEPALNGKKDVDSGTKEFKITFSQPMDPENYSVYYSKKGKELWPFAKFDRVENDNKTFVFTMDMFAGKDYEFIISDDEFATPDGFKMRDKTFTVKFSTAEFPWEKIEKKE